MTMERWDPFTEMSRMFGERFARPWHLTSQMGHDLPMDVCEMDDRFIIRAAAPGVRPEDFDISVKEDTLTIRGEIQAPEWMHQEQWSQQQSGQQSQQTQPSRGQQPQASGQMSHPQNVHCWLQEIPYGRFTRSVTLPTAVNGDNARAEFYNGLLVLHLPKAEAAKPRRIEVQTTSQRPQVTSGQNVNRP